MILRTSSIILLIISISACAVNPYNRDVQCSDYKSENRNQSLLPIEITTKSGEKLLVAAFGSASNPKKLSIHYAKNCDLDILRDVSKIERVSDIKQNVTLRNGKVVEIRSYMVYENETLITLRPYSESPISLIYFNASGKLLYRHDFDLLKELDRLDVINVAFTPEQNKALEELKSNEKKIELMEQERRNQELAAQEKEKDAQRERIQVNRDNAKNIISKKQNYGRKICKNGTLQYSKYTGIMMFGKPYYINHSTPGQVMAYLEDFSDDGYRIKIRVAGWGIEIGRLELSASPTLDGLTAQEGMVSWSDVLGWFICD